jgi:hypothetical protein
MNTNLQFIYFMPQLITMVMTPAPFPLSKKIGKRAVKNQIRQITSFSGKTLYAVCRPIQSFISSNRPFGEFETEGSGQEEKLEKSDMNHPSVEMQGGKSDFLPIVAWHPFAEGVVV